jgi:CRP-like cAMP-binding protein
MTERELIDKVPWLALLSEDARDALAARARIAVWDAGDVVCRQDEEDQTCFVLAYGAMRVSRALPDGRAVTLTHLHPPEAFGELALLGAGRRTATVSALEDSSGIALDAEAVLEALHGEPRAALAIAVDLAARLAVADERLLRYTLGTAAGGVSATLLAWLQARRDGGAGPGDVEVMGGVGDVARSAGIPKRAALRFMSHLELEGTITMRGSRTVIHDRDALARYLH